MDNSVASSTLMVLYNHYQNTFINSHKRNQSPKQSLPVFSVLLSPSDQIRSVAQSCLTLCDPMNCSTPGLPVHHQLPEFTQTHVH